LVAERNQAFTDTRITICDDPGECFELIDGRNRHCIRNSEGIHQNGHEYAHVSRKLGYENTGERQVAIVAVLHPPIQWTAYIGATCDAFTKSQTVTEAATNGNKLRLEVARFLFAGQSFTETLPWRD
jgi:hypothetical protein